MAPLIKQISAAQLSRRIIGDVQEFATGTEPCDDITLVIIKGSGEDFLGAHE